MKKLQPTKPIKKAPTATPILWIALGGIVLVIGGFTLIDYLKRRRRRERIANENLTVSIQRNTSSAALVPPLSTIKPAAKGFRCLRNSYPLEYGTCHPDVMTLQRYLKKAGADLGNTGPGKDGVDGQFGSLTQKAASKHLNKESFSQSDVAQLKLKA